MKAKDSRLLKTAASALALYFGLSTINQLRGATVIVPPDAFWDVIDRTQTPAEGLGSKQAPFGSIFYSSTCSSSAQPPPNTPWSFGWLWSVHKTVDLTGYDLSTIKYSIAVDNDYNLFVNGQLVDSGGNSGCAAWFDLRPLPNLVCGLNDIRVDIDNDNDDLAYFGMVIATDCYSFPIVSLSSPANLSTFCGTSPITITAKADEFSIGGSCSGTISKVDFYDGATLLGTVTTPTTSPDIYSFTWANHPTAFGAHTITAKATDNQGKATTSRPVLTTMLCQPDMVGIQAEGYSPVDHTVTIPSGNGASVEVVGTMPHNSTIRVRFSFHWDSSSDFQATGYLTDYTTATCFSCNGTGTDGYIVEEYSTGGYDATGHIAIPAGCCTFGCFTLNTIPTEHDSYRGFTITLLPDDQPTPTYQVDPSASQLTVIITQ